MFDFREQVIASLDRLIESNTIPAAINKALGECVQTVIRDELRSYSEFGKRLTAAVKRSLQVPEEFDLPSYNDTIVKIVRRQVETKTRNAIQLQVEENLKELLGPIPESIALSKLVEEYVEHIKERNSHGCHCGDNRIGFEMRVEDRNGYRTVTLHSEAERSRGTPADIQFGTTKEGVLYYLHFGGSDVEKLLFAGPFYGFERMLFQMKAARSRIEFDCEEHEIETSYELVG